MMVTLGELLRQLCAQTPLVVSLSDDLPLPQPVDLMHPDCHARIGDTITQAALSSGLSFYGACAFGEWLAELCTGWSTRFANEDAILRLDTAFGQTAYGNPKEVIRLYLLPSWEALTEHLPEVQRGVAAAFAKAKAMGRRLASAGRRTEKSWVASARTRAQAHARAHGRAFNGDTEGAWRVGGRRDRF
jgi:hypothetical protein